MKSKFLNKVMFVAMLVFMLNLGGCSLSIAGKYWSKERSSDYLELRSDKTFSIKTDMNCINGKYIVERGILTLYLPDGEVKLAVVANDTITDKDNKKWVK